MSLDTGLQHIVLSEMSLPNVKPKELEALLNSMNNNAIKIIFD
jgi:hypothetical protein